MLNEYLLEIEEANAFSTVKAKVAQYKKEHPDKDVISLGIGDVSKPLCQPIAMAMKKAVDDLCDMNSFTGYGLYYGLDALKQTLLDHEYGKYGFTLDDLYISDGAKTDSTSILELFDVKSKVLVADPVYPIYVNGAKALSRDVYYTPLDENFKMVIPNEKYDVIYICSPNNPIGNAYTYDDLRKWIAYALENNSVIIYDNVYNCFVTSKDVPESIYELENSKKCCIEIRSFSKIASFTSLRCSYYVLPQEMGLTKHWKERTLNRFNGASYVSQRGAIAVYDPVCQKELKDNIQYYLDNAQMIREGFEKAGFEVIGGKDAPYLWIKCKGCTSWQMFDLFLKEINVVIIPGIIFGLNGDNYFRVSALGDRKDSSRAIERIVKYYEK